MKKLKQWECVLVGHHSNVGRPIEEFESKGWKLHTYSAAQLRGSEINHYLLFEKANNIGFRVSLTNTHFRCVLA